MGLDYTIKIGYGIFRGFEDSDEEASEAYDLYDTLYDYIEALDTQYRDALGIECPLQVIFGGDIMSCTGASAVGIILGESCKEIYDRRGGIMESGGFALDNLQEIEINEDILIRLKELSEKFDIPSKLRWMLMMEIS